MYETLWLDAAAFVGLVHLAAPIALRNSFRFSANSTPRLVTEDRLSPEAARCILAMKPQIQSLGFELLGCYEFAELNAHTSRTVAYFCNRTQNDFAHLVISSATNHADSYLEFSTSFSNGFTLETNNNSVPPLTPDNPQTRLFRFSEIRDPRELYSIHLELIDKYAHGICSEAEPKGQELKRMVRVLENYGPRHEQMGYMRLASDGAYRLTWKGAALMAWRGLWPTSLIRQISYRQAMRNELRSLEVRGVAALQKA